MERAARVRCAGVAAFVYTAFFAGWLWLRVGGDQGVRVFTDVAGIAPGVVAAVACVAAAGRHDAQARRAWLCLAVGAGFWSAGDLAWAVYELGLGQLDPFPSWADVGYLGFYPAAMLGLLAFPPASALRAARLRTLADAVLIALSAFYVSWVLVLRELFSATAVSGLPRVLALAYPIADVALLSVVVLVASRAPHAHRAPFALLSLAMVANGFANSVYAYSSTTLSYQAGSLLDVVWVVALLLMAVAAVAAVPQNAGGSVVEPHEDRGWLHTLMPYALTLPAAGVAVLQALGSLAVDRISIAVGVAIVGIVLARQLLTLGENAMLTKRLTRTVEELQRRELDLQHQAFHDPLTGLANRALFRDRLDHAVDRAHRDVDDIAVIFLDLDDFKLVNDLFGHEAGDELLIAVAARLHGAVRSADTLARLGGDEFAVLVTQGGFEGARLTAERITGLLSTPFQLFQRELDVHASIGVALSVGTFADAENLLRDADLAMYSAKYSGKGHLTFYAPHMRAQVGGEHHLRNDLQRAVHDDQLLLVYLNHPGFSGGWVLPA